MKYLVVFEKAEPLRWLGHLDVLRAFERAVRRSRLPIAFTSGFNPRARLTFASALGVGTTGEAEVMTIELTEDLPATTLVQRMNACLPAGLRLLSAETVPDHGSRDLLNSYDRAQLRLTCSLQQAGTQEQVEAVLAQLRGMAVWEITREREGRARTLDLRPFVLDIAVERLEGQEITFLAIVTIGQEGGARPSEIADLLASLLPGLELRRAHRVRLYQSVHPSDARRAPNER